MDAASIRRDAQQQITTLLTQRKAAPPIPAVAAAEELLLSTPVEAAPPPPARAAAPPQRFSAFLPDQMRQAIDLAAHFMEVADRVGGSAGLQAVAAEANKAAQSQNLDLVKFALLLFMTHHPQGSTMNIPSLEERDPNKILSSSAAPVHPLARSVTPALPTDVEAQLAWYREDPKANEHHEHWHVVYPHAGVSMNPQSSPQLKDRQDELFLYMHEQMLARYDTERLGINLPRVKPLSNYRENIPEQYNPGPNLHDAQGHPYAARPAGLHMGDLPDFSYTVHDMEVRRDAILAATKSGVFEQNGRHISINSNNLGATIEASIGSVSSPGDGVEPDLTSTYGNQHNMGHMFLAYITDPQKLSQLGVMSDVATAIRDPVFYRWHKHIDDFSFTWQESQPPHTFSDAPKVLIRKGLKGAAPANQSPDIILAFKDDGTHTGPVIPGSNTPGFNGQLYGEQHFGGNNWNTDFSQSTTTTGELHTRMFQRTITWPDTGQQIAISYLDQDKEFFYFIRVENQLSQVQDVTVRIFLVAQQVAEDRRMWIEMDKFHYTLQPSTRTVIFRRADQSSVIKKPVVRPPGSQDHPQETGDPAEDDLNYCNCGWPYNLLLPRGTHQGMGFRLQVMLTDWQIDRVASDSSCGSMSYCGARDKYPDSRGMGYPFDRRSPSNQSIAQVIAAQSNMATRDIVIKWLQ
jgi:hypothetical protein